MSHTTQTNRHTYLIMTDLHGCLSEFEQALSHWNPRQDTLVLLGDYIDRGTHSMQLVQRLMQLKEQYPEQTIFLQGNHENDLTHVYHNVPPVDFQFFYSKQHTETYKSAYAFKHPKGEKAYKKASRLQRMTFMLRHYKDELLFLKNLPYYKETEHCIFVHAGLNLESGTDWRDDTKAMLTHREEFYASDTSHEKTVFFGHTPTHYLHDTANNDVWVSPDKKRVALDGGLCFNGQLNAVRVDAYGNLLETFTVKSQTP